ncbi:MAG: hypothetical protein BWZ09_01814 [Alphaproteobacteria bacterium ADurb.BinA305]|nr:MAG: hypothetical protein BWZ09_01814 [Alphaproteobacteria bacterium ADurb.BinA305]
MAEGLHHQVGGEAEAGEVLELVAGHRAGGVLAADGGHLGFAVGTRADALAFRHAAGAADHLLRQAEALAGIGGGLRQAEQRRGRQAEGLARLGGEAAADDQRNAATGAHFVEDDQGLELRFGDHGAVLERGDLAGSVVDLELDLVAHVHLAGVDLDRQRAGIFHGVEEDRGDLGAEAHAAETLVRDEGDVLAGEPQHRVGGGLARGTGADHVTDVGDQVALGTQLFEELDRAAHARFFRGDARTRVLEHGQRVQRDVGARPGVGCGRQVVGVGLAGDLEDGELLRGGDFRAAGEPLGVGPRLHHGFGVGVALLGQLLDVVEVVEHQQGLLETLGGDRAHFGVGQQIDHRLDVEAAQHGAEQLGGLGARHQGTGFLALGDPGQELGLDLGGVIHAGGDAVGEQLDEEGLLAGGGVLEQLDEFGGLLLGERQRRDAEGGTFGDMGTVGFKHGDFLTM